MFKKLIFSILFISSVFTNIFADEINYKNSKITYVDFWASWCPPCLASFPWMDAMQQKYKNQGLNIIAVNLDEDKTLAQKFLQKSHVSFSIKYKNNFQLAEKLGVVVMPTSFIMDSGGKVIYKHQGFNNKAKIELENKFKKLLKL